MSTRKKSGLLFVLAAVANYLIQVVFTSDPVSYAFQQSVVVQSGCILLAGLLIDRILENADKGKEDKK